MGELFLISSFVASYALGKRSPGLGVSAVIVMGSIYGILRANFLSDATYFVFDATIFGVYAARLPQILERPERIGPIRFWVYALLIWPVLYLSLGGMMFPQHPLVQLVGLRAAIFFVPFILLGAEFSRNDVRQMTLAIAATNLVTLAFALAEYVLGIERFYPQNAATEIIYKSNDVAGYTAYRIPATFAHSAAYGAYLILGFPLLVMRLIQRNVSLRERLLLAAAVVAASMGVFICGSRTPVVSLGVLVLATAVLLRHRPEAIALLVILVAGVIYQVTQEERFQRVLTLADTETTANRLELHVNMGILDVVTTYPLGVGLGGAWGTNIPGFLMEYAFTQIGAENEWARIALEQSVIGALIWIVFVAWVVRRSWVNRGNFGTSIITILILYNWVGALLGAGLLAGIPSAAMLFVYMGINGAGQGAADTEAPVAAKTRRPRAKLPLR